MRINEFKFTVTFDDNDVPETINWSAGDAQGDHSTKAMTLSFWDAAERESMRLDLWTKGMMVDEMTTFCYQNLLSIADAYERATGKKDAAAAIRTAANQIV